MIYSEKDSNNILEKFFSKEVLKEMSSEEKGRLELLSNTTETIKKKTTEHIDWDKIKDKMVEEIFAYDPGLKWVLRYEFQKPEKLIEWFKKTLENI